MKSHKTRVALLVGGPSSEHEISLLSGRTIHKYLDEEKFDVIPILIDRKGRWPIELEDLPNMADIAFIGMHGEYGEDGVLQETLRDLDIPYTWSDPMASALAMNKPMAYRVFQAHGIKVPNAKVFERHNINNLDVNTIELPAVIKPVNKGSLAGISLVRRAEDLKTALDRAFTFGRNTLVENFISGTELSCGVMDDGMGNVFPLPIVGGVARAGVNIEHNQRGISAPHEIKLARLSSGEIDAAQATAVKVHQAVGASGASKAHMIIGEDGELYVLGVNTIPIMTETSFFPLAVLAHGLSLPEMFERIIETAFVRHQSLRKLK
jgi:D-alanine-D-alanine ligase